MASDEQPEPKFEDALNDLEKIVAVLERGDTELSDALAQYERGVRLLARCHKLLDSAEQTVALLTKVDEAGNPETAPFDTTATTERERSSTPPPARKSRSAPRKKDDEIDVPF